MTAGIETTRRRDAAPQMRRALRLGPFSTVLRWRPLLVPLLGLAVLAVLFTVNVGIGDVPISPARVAEVLLGGGDRVDQLVVFQLRLPRSLTGILVGLALGLAGALMQTLSRNPLASPDTLGISWGAATAATAVIVFGGELGTASGATAALGLPLVALVGGLLTGTVVYLLARRGGLDSLRLLLVGVGVGALAGNATFWLLTLGDVNDAGRAMVWLTGSLNARGWEHVVPLAVALVLVVPATLVGAHALGALQYDEDTVRGLGVRVELSRGLLLVAAVVLASLATAAAGPVLFVALAMPQVALRLAGTPRPPLIASGVLGAVLVLGSDLLAREVVPGTELPVGIVTSVLGAPYLIFLLVRRYRESST